MPQPNKIPRPFADSGDKNSIPDSSGSIGFASWQEGFPAITSEPFASGGVAPKRADFNGIFNALSLATVWQQQGGFYAYDNTTDYEVGNVVEYNNDLYKCITANGPSSAVKAPTDTTVWSKVMTAADTAALYLPLSGGSIANSNDAVALRPGLIEISAVTPFIDFHHANTQTDYSARIINSDDGQLQLFITNDSNVSPKSLTLKSDGTLKWNGKDVERLEEHVNDQYIRLSSGLMIAIGRTQISATGTAITFSYPYATTPIIAVTPAPSADTTDVYTIITTNRSATGFTLFANRSSAHFSSYAAWHAIGRWK